MKAIPIFPLAALMLAAACGGSPTAPTPTTGGWLGRGLRDFTEALFLSDGPLSSGHEGQPSSVGFMGGFPVGSQITVRFLNTINEDQRNGIRDLTGVCNEKLGGELGDGAIPCSMGLTFTYSETSDRGPILDAIQGGPNPLRMKSGFTTPRRGQEGTGRRQGDVGGVVLSPSITTRLGLV